MVLLVLEGIATSGKSTIIRLLTRIASQKGITVATIGEDRTLLPVLDKKLSIESRVAHVQKIIAAIRLAKPVPSILVVDRLIFTHAVIGATSLRPYMKIESKLKSLNVLIVLLTIPRKKIKGRLMWALANRDSKWKKHVRAKGNLATIMKYYQIQQSQLLHLARDSMLPVHVIDTGDRNFREIAIKLFRILVQKANAKTLHRIKEFGARATHSRSRTRQTTKTVPL